jgi:hypothetical protein
MKSFLKKMWLVAAVATYLGCNVAWAADPPSPDPGAGPGNFQLLTFSDGNQYYIITPADYNPQYQYPVVCYLASSGLGATAVAETAAFMQNYPCIYIAPWCPKTGGPNPGSWSNYINDTTESFWVFTWNGTLTPGGQFAVNLIKYVIANYSVNPARVYLFGESDGAFGCSEIAAFNNNLISGVLTISGAGATGDPKWGFRGPTEQTGASGSHVEAPSEASYAKNLINMPFWAYHGSNDPTVPVGQDNEWISHIISDGGSPNLQHFTVVQGQHTIWDPVYQDLSGSGPWAWLFAQRKGSSGNAPTSFNFNGADLVWENTADGERLVWLMNKGVPTGSVSLPTVDPSWHIAGEGDFLGNGQLDLVWERTDGEHLIWIMVNGAPQYAINLPTVGGGWHLVGTGDFNHDGQADLVWENSATGQREIWLMNQGTPTTAIQLGTVDPSWHIAGEGDFLGNGQADLVWENTVTGGRVIWLMNNGTPTSSINLPTVDLNWHIGGVADFMSTGQASLVWENSVTGQCLIWDFNNGQPTSAVPLPTVPTSWHIVNH